MNKTFEFGRRVISSDGRLIVAEDGVERRLCNQDASELEGVSISIQINVDRSKGPAKEKRSFSLLSSKLF